MNTLNNHPDFLVIGAQKAGTTWLYQQLTKHPNVFIPPVKEVHYFDRSQSYNSPSRLALESLEERINSSSHSAKEWREHLLNHIKNAEREDIFQSKWYLNYLFGNYNDEWYKSLFLNQEGNICGDITPSYSILNKVDIDKVKEMFPKLKIIFLIRNPIDRDWSHFRYDCHIRNVKPSNINTDKIIDFINKKGVRARSNYMETIKRWTQAFSKEKILISYYDDLKNKPLKLLNEICLFLGINYSNKYFTEQMLTQKFNKSPKTSIPIEVESKLLQIHINQLENLSQNLGGYTTQWLLDSRTKMNNIA